jgi:two-component system phosphate regulon sensor histidine kinase PhoR
MAARLNNRIRKVVQQRNELEAVLGSMVEGVVALDQDQRVIRMNPAGAELLGTDPDTAVGRTIQEVVRNPELQSVVAEALREEGTVEGDVTLPGQQEERSMRVRATTLRDADGKATGTLLVLQDVTRLRRLQQIRRDFVANVSHELRTPITAIKGFAETLLEEGGDEPEQRRRFLDIIARQANRLESIFEDLLSLSRAERLSERGAMELTMEPLEPVLESAVELVRRAAGDRGVAVEVDCPPDLTARINAALLEQAVFNLVDNAVRYSPEGASVQVTARPSDGEVVISVRDTGPGIASEHLPRIFERFYRADRGRDRSSGGTGLGLAIVKHVAQSHGGRVSVESTPGQGSTFTIHLPAA